MSLANLFVQGGRVVLQADAAASCADGTIAWLGPKLHVLSTLPCAFTVRGNFLPDVFAEVLGAETFLDVDGFLHRLPQLLPRLTALTKRAGIKDPLFCFYIACVTQGRPWGFLLANDKRWFAGQDVRSGELKPVLNTIGALVPASEMLGRNVDFADPCSFNIEHDSLALIEAQRARPWADFPLGSNPAAVPAIRIGGWVDQAEVTSAGVTVRKLIEWTGDREGELIAA